MSPGPIVDYLVVHELCYLGYHNHSKEYWNKVRSIILTIKVRGIGWKSMLTCWSCSGGKDSNRATVERRRLQSVRFCRTAERL